MSSLKLENLMLKVLYWSLIAYVLMGKLGLKMITEDHKVGAICLRYSLETILIKINLLVYSCTSK